MNYLYLLRRLATIILTVYLCGCGQNSSYLLNFYAVDQPSPDSFFVCHGYSCRYKVEAQLTESIWQDITSVFSEPTETAAAERLQIAQAIALFEQHVGNLTGISEDLPKSPAFKNAYGQQDCIDETVNTTTYLRMLQTANLLQQHRLSDPAKRGYFVDTRWPHNTATIKKMASGQSYVIDSWPGANGELPEIKTLEQWLLEGEL